MRSTAVTLLLFTLTVAGDEDRVVKDEACNFSIACPDSPDWEVKKLDPEGDKYVKASFLTLFADSEPPAEASVKLVVCGISSTNDKVSLEKMVERWTEAYEGDLTGVRDRVESSEGTFGGEKCCEVDLKGDSPYGTHRRTWLIARMGKCFYILIADRRNAAAGDADVDAEIKQARDSFAFLRKEKPATDKEATGDAPVPGGGTKKPKKVDPNAPTPEQLAQEKLSEDFWRFDYLKPLGFVKQEVRDDEKASHIRVKLVAVNGETSATCTIYVIVDTDKSVKYTLEQLKERYVTLFMADAEKTSAKMLDEDDSYKGVPLSKKSIMWYAVKVIKSSVKERWILADCKNERQYQIRVYCASGGDTAFKEGIAQFLKSFKPFEK